MKKLMKCELCGKKLFRDVDAGRGAYSHLNEEGCFLRFILTDGAAWRSIGQALRQARQEGRQSAMLNEKGKTPVDRAVDILRSACLDQDNVPIIKQSCPEDMALWAVTKIERLERELAEARDTRKQDTCTLPADSPDGCIMQDRSPVRFCGARAERECEYRKNGGEG